MKRKPLPTFQKARHVARNLTTERMLAGKTYGGPSPATRRRFKLWLSYPLTYDIDSWDVCDRLPSPALRGAFSGYQFGRCLQATPLGETWTLSSCEGQRFLAHCFPDWDPHLVWPCLEELEKICQTGIGDWHLERYGDNRLALSTPLEGKTLKMHFEECWQSGKIGLSADELLEYLRPIAVTLDELKSAYQIQHLALNPHAILLQRDEVQLSGFGLAALFSCLSPDGSACNNPYYAAPEQYIGKISDTTDEFSLCLIYLALRTGVHPWKNWKLDAAGRDRPNTFDWSQAPRAELNVLRRGLALDPRRRFAHCTELIDALRTLDRTTVPTRTDASPSALPALLVETSITPFLNTHERWVAEMVRLANTDKTLFTSGSLPVRVDSGKEIVHRVGFRLSWGELWERLERFCLDVNICMPSRNDLSLEMFVPKGNLQIGRSAGLKLLVENLPDDDHASEVIVRISPVGCWNREGAVQMLHHDGLELLHRLRQHLLEKPDQRLHPRHRWQERLVVHPVMSWAKLAAPIVAQAQDISFGGISLVLSADLPEEQFYLSCPEQRQLKAYAGLARIVRRKRLAGGAVEIGACFTS